jgi:pyruvate/2-oxoglutarate dehydrogenase complex dihydrolipoamide dehydrogenase (E3) component
MAVLKPDICIIGAGAAGLAVAAGAAQMGASVVIVERHKMGGESLHYGCIPSKSLLAAGRAHATLGEVTGFGIRVGGPNLVNYADVHQHIQQVITDAAPTDSLERYTSLGCTVIMGRAQFINNQTVQVGDTHIRARRFVVATGSRPSVPNIDGLKAVPFLTNETIFNLTERPRHLVIIGGGTVGTELGQAYRNLGSDVTIITQSRLLSQEDPDLTAVLRRRLESQGIRVIENSVVQRFAGSGDNLTVDVHADNQLESIAMSHVLVAVGRSPRISSLHPESGGIVCSPRGIKVDEYLRTTNRRVYALGDCIGAPFFTHVSQYEAEVVLQNALLGRRRGVDYTQVPRVLYTDPEIASVGLAERAARAKYKDITVLRSGFAAADRARTNRVTDGLMKVMVRRNGSIVGVGIVGAHAGELLLPWQLAMANGLRADALAGAMVAYPTLSEISKITAAQFTASKQQGALRRLFTRMIQVLP